MCSCVCSSICAEEPHAGAGGEIIKTHAHVHTHTHTHTQTHAQSHILILTHLWWLLALRGPPHSRRVEAAKHTSAYL